jgi:hypothetical protein
MHLNSHRQIRARDHAGISLFATDRDSPTWLGVNVAWALRGRCSGYVGNEAASSTRGGWNTENRAVNGRRPAAGGYRVDRHDPRVVVGRPGP